jgi:hypothetical protein
MRGLSISAVLVTALMLIGGCAAPEIPYDKTVAAQVKTIGIVTPRFPEGPSVILASTVGQSFGLIGAMVDAGMKANRDSRFKAALEKENFSLSSLFIERLGNELRAEGYEVASVQMPRDKTDFLASYTAAPVDAYLDIVTMGYGYIAAGIGSSLPYRPYIVVRARLVKAQGSAVLMQDAVVYNFVGQGDAKSFVTVPPDPNQQFTDFDTLIADPPNAVKGIETAADKTARTVAKLLDPAL